MVFVGDISTINGIINQLITWGAPPCSYVTNYQRVQELFQCPFSFDSRGLRVQRLPWKQVFWGYPKGLKQPNIGNWLVVWNMNSMTFHEKLGISSSQLTSCHIFRRGRSTTNQGNDHFFWYQTWIKTISRWMGEPKSWHLKRFLFLFSIVAVSAFETEDSYLKRPKNMGMSNIVCIFGEDQIYIYI